MKKVAAFVFVILGLFVFLQFMLQNLKPKLLPLIRASQFESYLDLASNSFQILHPKLSSDSQIYFVSLPADELSKESLTFFISSFEEAWKKNFSENMSYKLIEEKQYFEEESANPTQNKIFIFIRRYDIFSYEKNKVKAKDASKCINPVKTSEDISCWRLATENIGNKQRKKLNPGFLIASLHRLGLQNYMLTLREACLGEIHENKCVAKPLTNL